MGRVSSRSPWAPFHLTQAQAVEAEEDTAVSALLCIRVSAGLVAKSRLTLAMHGL